MFHFRYAGQAAGPAYEQWREEYARQWLAADFQPLDGDYLVNEFAGSEHSFLGVCTLRGTPVHTVRRGDVQGEARDWLYFVVAAGARLEAWQRGRSSDLGVGQMALISNREPAWVRQTRGSRWSARIPQKMLKDLCRNFEDKVARPITANRELTGLLLHQMEIANRFGPKLGSAENHAMAQHILDLVGLCLGIDRDAAHAAEHRGLAAARFDAIKADILHRLAACDLSLAAVASRHGVSARYIQHLFERAGTSFTRFVLDQRLHMAHRLLQDPSHRWRKVNDVAAAAGFADISYFNRAFKARFAATPRDVRRLADRSAAQQAPETCDVPAPPLQPEWRLRNSDC
ncbi:MAG TPA: AraC family transcriptional regulator [Xanthobacteraceae bacterium]|nr:AraC family transcriptional regulator [Xanthobacteraceae bacterium]